MARARILCVDDETSPRESLRMILKDRYDFVPKDCGEAGLAALADEGPFDLVLLDMKMPDLTGLEVLQRLRAKWPVLPVIMITAISDAKIAVQAMKLGAADYLTKPFDVPEIRLVVARALQEQDQRREPARPAAAPVPADPFAAIIGDSPAMRQLFALVQRLLPAETTVLITGETGTGKELVARALHYGGPRRDGPFIPVHCAAIPNELLESELFGHEKGAFTGAVQRRIGMFEAATGGTLFLDEIGEMPLGTQSKLLRAIQEREIRRVGSQETIHINVRLVCATNRNLEEEVKQGRFREDLFYRVNVVPLRLPSLRERPEDIARLVAHFADRFAKQLNRPAPQFSPAALARLARYSWPGNVRELEHLVERLLVIGDADPVEPAHLPFVITQSEPLPPAPVEPAPPAPASAELPATGMDLTKMTDDLERRAIEQALAQSAGVLTEAARRLNITRRMLRYKMDRLGIGGGSNDAA